MSEDRKAKIRERYRIAECKERTEERIGSIADSNRPDETMSFGGLRWKHAYMMPRRRNV